jgi:hypothetical protein
MKSLPAIVIALALAAPAAHAGTYVSAGVGNGAWTDGSLNYFSTDGQHSGRAMIGQRFPFVSIEGGLNYFGLSAKGPWSAYSTVADVKLDLPLIPLLSVYLKGGLEHTWILPGQGQGNTISGNGWLGAIGAEYKLDAIAANSSVWIDYSRHDDSLDFNQHVVGTANMVTIGFSVGI